MRAQVLAVRALNRVTPGRQMLRKRENTAAVKAVERLVGTRAQLALNSGRSQVNDATPRR